MSWLNLFFSSILLSFAMNFLALFSGTLRTSCQLSSGNLCVRFFLFNQLIYIWMSFSGNSFKFIVPAFNIVVCPCIHVVDIPSARREIAHQPRFFEVGYRLINPGQIEAVTLTACQASHTNPRGAKASATVWRMKHSIMNHKL